MPTPCMDITEHVTLSHAELSGGMTHNNKKNYKNNTSKFKHNRQNKKKNLKK
jgi:hypothetical protein